MTGEICFFWMLIAIFEGVLHGTKEVTFAPKCFVWKKRANGRGFDGRERDRERERERK